MNKIEWDTVDGVLEEADLWKLFSNHPDQKSDTILFFSQIKRLLPRKRLQDESRYYRIFHTHSSFTSSFEESPFRATVTQRNLRSVASAIAGRGNSDAVIQYLGTIG